MDDITRILAYLNDELNEDDKATFEEELASNDQLKQEFNFYQDLGLVGDIFGKDGVKEQLDRVWADKQTKEIKIGNKTWRYVAVAGILLVVGALVVWQIRRPKQWWQDTNKYAQILQQQKTKYAAQHLAVLDGQIAQQRSGIIETKLPAVDTLLTTKQGVLFKWDSTRYSRQKLEIEVFTKATQDTPKRWNIPTNKASFKTTLPPALYYWRLKIKDDATLHFGRFYVIDQP
jgi:hypothetical protein